jgi:CRISPR-associated protein Cas1
MKDLQYLPRFGDRWSHVYLEHGTLEKDDNSILFHDKEGQTPIPIDQLGLLFLGPGTKLTQQAMKLMAENNCLICWTGEEGVRLYAHSTGGTHSSHRLLRQAGLYHDENARLQVAKRMYQKRFPAPFEPNLSIEKLRGMEGARVRDTYRRIALEVGVQWHGRNYDQDSWDHGDPLNRALSSANACLYGICHAAILTAGYSAAIGFIHVGKMLSFVYDVADFYKTEIAIPVAFRTVAASTEDVERRVRLLCRDIFYEKKLLDRILPDIAEVLDAGNDLGERSGELEGRAVSLAAGAESRSLHRQPDGAGEGPVMEDGDGEMQTGDGDPIVEPPWATGV